MRRTEQEFKEELMKRTRAYRQKRARKRKQLLGAGLCVCICCVAMTVFEPFGSASKAAVALGDLKLESAVSMQIADGGGIRADEAPAENAAAPMAPAPEEAISDSSHAEVSAVTVICGEEEISLDAADSAVIMEYLLSDSWNMSAANCLCDYTLEAGGEIYRYHSDCGTIQNEYGESITLSESDQEIFNSILGRCPMRIEG